jgi:hypothetical protein
MTNPVAGHTHRDHVHRFPGIPTHVVVPSVSRAALLHGLAGTILVDTPSSAILARPVGELSWSCSAKPRTAAGAGGYACPASGGEGAPVVAPGPELTPDALPMPVVLPGAPLPTAAAGVPTPTVPAGAAPPPCASAAPIGSIMVTRTAQATWVDRWDMGKLPRFGTSTTPARGWFPWPDQAGKCASKQSRQSAERVQLPFPPVGRVNVDRLAGPRLGPAAVNPAAGEYQGVRAIVIDDGQFEFPVVGRETDGLPHQPF